MRSFALSLFVTALLAVAPRDASATVMVAQSIDQLRASADLIVVGAVTAQSSLWDSGHIVTDVEIAIETRVQGPAMTSVRVRIPGGLVGNVGQRLAGAPAFAIGQRYLLFLFRDARGGWQTVALSQGVLPVREVRVVAGEPPVALVYPSLTEGLELMPAPGTAITSSPAIPAVGLPLAAFIATLRR